MTITVENENGKMNLGDYAYYAIEISYIYTFVKDVLDENIRELDIEKLNKLIKEKQKNNNNVSCASIEVKEINEDICKKFIVKVYRKLGLGSNLDTTIEVCYSVYGNNYEDFIGLADRVYNELLEHVDNVVNMKSISVNKSREIAKTYDNIIDIIDNSNGIESYEVKIDDTFSEIVLKDIDDNFTSIIIEDVEHYKFSLLTEEDIIAIFDEINRKASIQSLYSEVLSEKYLIDTSYSNLKVKIK